ncbi:MAG: helix-turn-helix domain-containing protein [Microbacterium sp.]
MTDVRGPVRENARQAQTRLSASNRAELLAGYTAGVSVRELADRFGVHRGTVWEMARRAGLAVRQPELSESVRAQAAQLYGRGLTLAQVAAQLGISNEAVRSAVIACGGTIRPAGRRRRVHT